MPAALLPAGGSLLQRKEAGLVGVALLTTTASAGLRSRPPISWLEVGLPG